MRTLIHRRSIGLIGACSVLALGLWAGPAAAQTISGSKHDLTSTGTGANKTSSTAEICVFCHTPHGASASAPLWNRGAGSTSFTAYTSATMDGTALTVGSNSAACMSCHDGATALDLLINAPGSGGYNAAGASPTAPAWTWTGGNKIAAGITNLTTDLSNDHPIGIAYCGGFTAAGVCKDPDFKLTALVRNAGGTVTSGGAAAVLSAGATDQFWIDTGTANTTREKTDLILYVRAFGGNNQPSVECASCHEPHNGGATSTPFLRVANTASAVCTACHNK